MILRALKWLLVGVSGLILFVVVTLAVGLAYREWRQFDAEQHMTIDTPNGIDEMMFVDVGGSQQWITIRGQDRANPIVLVLHGGPGAPARGYAPSFLPWEKDFVVVQWDQPLAGRTFRAAGSEIDTSLTIDKMARVGNGLAEYLTDYLNAENVILLGWSWGSVLGVYMAQARPELFTAFVGTGQVVDIQEGEHLAYANVWAEASERGDTNAIRELEQAGPPPYTSMQALSTQRKWAVRYELDRSMFSTFLLPILMAPRISLADVYDLFSGMNASDQQFFGEALTGPLMQLDLRQRSLRFEVPMFIIHGPNDYFTPAALSRAYLENLQAPAKQFQLIEGAGHFALVSHSEEFLRLMQLALGSLSTSLGSNTL